MGWRYSRVTIAPGINDRDMVQERFLTELPDQWLEVAKMWKKWDLEHRWNGRLELGMFWNKKDRIGTKQTLMEVFCKLIVILFVAQDFLQGFPDVSQRLTEEWICNIDVIMFQRDCCKFGQTRLLELCISSMLHWCYVNKLVVCYVLCGFRM